jgi:hypothetical protein
MHNLSYRTRYIFGTIFFLLFSIYNWWSLLVQHSYWTVMAFGAPALCVTLLCYSVSPALSIQPRQGKDKLHYNLAVALAIAVGVLNAHFMGRIAGSPLPFGL